MEGTIRLRLLGPVQVERGGEPVGGFRSRKALALLGYLAGDVEARWAAGVMSREQAQRLWGMPPLTVQALLEAWAC